MPITRVAFLLARAFCNIATVRELGRPQLQACLGVSNESADLVSQEKVLSCTGRIGTIAFRTASAAEDSLFRVTATARYSMTDELQVIATDVVPQNGTLLFEAAKQPFSLSPTESDVIERDTVPVKARKRLRRRCL